MIYLNNAATSYPKPPCVLQEYMDCLGAPPDGQFRSSRGGESGDVMNSCRKTLAGLLGVSHWQGVYFTSGATEAANTLLSGLDIGDGVLATQTEHNCVLRPLYNMPRFKGRVGIVPCDTHGYVSAQAVKKAYSSGCRALFLNHCSNVTGTIQNLVEIGRMVKALGMLFIVDVSQSAGCIPINADECQIDALFFTGHKSLMGVQGTGGFYLRRGVSLFPYKFGGTGNNGELLTYTSAAEYDYEPGTQNLPGIAALKAAAEYVYAIGIEEIHRREAELMQWLRVSLEKIPHVHLYTAENPSEQGPVLSLNIDGMKPGDTAYILRAAYDITVRAGVHCSPLIHNAIGSGSQGTVRVSISHMTTKDELLELLKAIEDISGGLA